MTGKKIVSIHLDPKIWDKFKKFCKEKGVLLAPTMETILKQVTEKEKAK